MRDASTLKLKLAEKIFMFIHMKFYSPVFFFLHGDLIGLLDWMFFD